MAEYSKEFVDFYGMGFKPDFCIQEEFEKLPPDHYVPMICEGYGFFAISKNEGKCILLYRDYENEDSDIIEVPFEELNEYWQTNINPKI